VIDEGNGVFLSHKINRNTDLKYPYLILQCIRWAISRDRA
jgi:hypothetical protein